MAKLVQFRVVCSLLALATFVHQNNNNNNMVKLVQFEAPSIKSMKIE